MDMKRFADAANCYVQNIEDLENRSRSYENFESPNRRWAARLDQYAWFLAHCPDDEVRDTAAAIHHAKRATELQPEEVGYWYTLAMVQYRNRDWQNSLRTIEVVKEIQDGITAHDWILIAMNRYGLNQKGEADAALAKAKDWLNDRKESAGEDPVLRIQYEILRSQIDALLREAEDLINGKTPPPMGVASNRSLPSRN